MTTKKKQFPTHAERWHTWAKMQRLFRQKNGKAPSIGCSIYKWVQLGKLQFASDIPKKPAQGSLFKNGQLK